MASIFFRGLLFLTLLISAYSRVYAESTLPQTMGMTVEGLRFTIASAFLNNLDQSRLNIQGMQVTSPVPGVTGQPRNYFVRYKFSTNQGDANQNKDHLVIVIPGFGGMSEGGLSAYLMELLTRSGFAAASLDSPPSERFLTHSSRFGFPGVQEFDAQDLYEGIQLSKTQLENVRRRPFTKVSVIGTSLGGLNTSQVLLHSLRPTSLLKFHRAISINPPISNVYGLTLIDHLVSNYFRKITGEGKSIGKVESLAQAFYNQLLSKISYEDLEASVTRITNPLVPITQDAAAYLVGFSFSDIVASAIKGTAAHMNLSADQSKSVMFYEVFNGITVGGLNAVRLHSPQNYFVPHAVQPTVQIPNINQEVLRKMRGGEAQSEFLTRSDDIQIESSSIRYNVDTLKNAKNYILITNEDDFLLRTNVTIPKTFEDDDKTWIRANFNGVYTREAGANKARSKIYFEGGHLGGYYQKQFQTDLIRFLSEQ